MLAGLVYISGSSFLASSFTVWHNWLMLCYYFDPRSQLLLRLLLHLLPLTWQTLYRQATRMFRNTILYLAGM